jgi:hypothetical protein
VVTEERTNVGTALGFDELENDDVINCSIHTWNN